MKFKEYLSEPQNFTEGERVIDADVSKEEFYEMLLEEDDVLFDYDKKENISKEDFIKTVKEDWVHFHINGDDEYFENRPAWRLGSKGIKGAKKVWVLF